MRKFFELKITGRSFLRPMAAILLSTLLFCSGFVWAEGLIGGGSDAAMTVVDGRFALYLLACGAMCFAYGFVVMWALLPIMTTTINALHYDNAPFQTEYNRGDYLRLVAKDVALSVVTFGIYTPWFLASLMRFFAEGVSHKFNLMSFRGKGMRLLAIVVLTYLVPMMVVLLLADVVMADLSVASVDMMSFVPLALLAMVLSFAIAVSMYTALVCEWSINLTYGDRLVVARLPLWGAVGYIMGQIALTLLTLGLYVPMAYLRVCRYIAEHTYVEAEEQKPLVFGLRLLGWRDWGFVWVQLLLVMVTFGLYTPWYYARIMSRFGSRLYIADN